MEKLSDTFHIYVCNFKVVLKTLDAAFRDRLSSTNLRKRNLLVSENVGHILHAFGRFQWFLFLDRMDFFDIMTVPQPPTLLFLEV